MVRAYQKLIDRLRACKIFPKHQVLDNEISEEYKEAIRNNEMTYQLVPPHDHRRNIAEKAIQTFKSHLIAVLCGTAENFPLHLWDRLLPQTEKTLNMLRQSRLVPNVSSYAHLYGQHDYNAHPMGPLGCAVEAHVTPSKRETFEPHSASGWYLGVSFEHYRCHDIYIKDTKGVRTCQTVFFKHKYLTMPTITKADAIIKSAEELSQALKGNLPQNCTTETAIRQLMDIFKQEAADYVRPKNVPLQRVNEDTPASQRVTITPSEREQELDFEEIPQPKQTSLPIISQDEGPARSTRYHTRSITQELALSAISIPGNARKPTAQQASRRRYPMQFLCEFAGAVMDGATGELLEYRHLIKRPKYKAEWNYSYGNEVGRLAQGMKGRVEGTNTIFFIHKHEIPKDRRKDCTYGKINCNVRPQKEEKNRTRLTIGGDRINYEGDCGTATADLLTTKLLLNSVISTEGARFMTLDIKNFYLGTPLKKYEYLRLKMSDLPDDVIEEYNLRPKAVDGHVYVECRKGMYGLPHTGLIPQQLLEKRLNQHGYKQSKTTPGLWTHEWRKITFTLIVDDFGVKYVGKDNINHLIQVLEEHYEITKDWEGLKYGGINMDWDYTKRVVHLSMPNYVTNALQRFAHEFPKKPQHQPHQHAVPAYGQKIQYAKNDDTSQPLSTEEKRFVQQVLGTFLFYGRAIDGTMLTALSTIASFQATPTQETMKKTKLFLDYAATHPDAVLTYRKSDMVLAVHSDASYLTEPQARSRAGGHHYLSSDVELPPNNGAVLNIAQIIKAVMSSAAEAEIGALFINAREAIPARMALIEMGHKQPKTPIQTDNTTALGVVNRNLQPRRTKAMDMRFHWLRDRAAQAMFRFFWQPGKTNWGDYWTKHHCSAHHQQMRPEFVTPSHVVNALRASLKRKPHKYRASERVC